MGKYSLEYDPQADAVYIKMIRRKVSKTVEIDDTTMADLDKKNHIIGIEIINFSKTKVDLTKLITEQLGENIVSVVK